MLAIRMKRTGRKGHAQFRLVVQDSRFSPKSGRVVAYVGSYNPHAKTATLDKAKLEQYMVNGAHPSERVAKLLQAEGIKMPNWVKQADPKIRSIRHADKLRRNRPADEAPAAPVEEPAAEADSPAEPTQEAPLDETDVASEEESPAAEATEEPDKPAQTPDASEEAAVETPTEESQ